MKTYLPFLGLFISLLINAQVGIGTTSPDTSASLDINSNNSGVLIPRLTNIQMNNIVSPAEGLVVYNKTSDSFWYYNLATATWEELGDDLGNHIAEQNLEMTGNWISYDGDSEGIYIRNNGNIGINESVPTSVLHINATGSGVRVETPGTSPLGSAISMVSSVGNPVIRYQLGDGAGSVTQTWDLRVDDSTNDFVIRDVTNSQDMLEISNASGRIDVGTNGDGSFIRANAFTLYSDRRLKAQISPIEKAIESLSKISGYTYYFKNDPKKRIEFGVMAQEIKTIIPNAVHEDEKGIKSVDYNRIIPLLIEAVKEQQKEINNLKKLIVSNEKK